MTNQNSIPDPQTDEQSWKPCDQGAIMSLVKRLKQQRQIKRVKQVAITATCVLVGLFVGNQFLSSPQSLSHDRVEELAQSFINGELDAGKTKLVEAHIAKCPRCEHLLEERALKQSQARLVMPDNSVVMINFPQGPLVASTR